MKVEPTRRRLREQLASRGLRRLADRNRPEKWYRPGLDVSPYFGPDVLRKGGGATISGMIGVHVFKFEEVWSKLRKKYCPEFVYENYNLFGQHMSNYLCFIAPPVVRDDSDEQLQLEREWVDNVIDTIDELPNSMDKLLSDLSCGRMGPYPADHYVHGGVKWLMFLRWLEESGCDIPHQLYDLRADISPFDTQAMIARLNDRTPLGSI